MKKKILLVDDDGIFVDMLKETLENFINEKIRFDVEGVNSTDHVVELSKRNKYDFLIIDYLIDGRNGKQVVEKIREFDKEICIILLTGHSDYVFSIGALKEMEIQLYMEKSPAVPEKIIREIMNLIC
ncbi:MAG: response regulator [Clostridiaceae bacterium]|nr:response regulator [Clostridiaceae bacterium]